MRLYLFIIHLLCNPQTSCNFGSLSRRSNLDLYHCPLHLAMHTDVKKGIEMLRLQVFASGIYDILLLSINLMLNVKKTCVLATFAANNIKIMEIRIQKYSYVDSRRIRGKVYEKLHTFYFLRKDFVKLFAKRIVEVF